jgi:hypothetical protein
MVMVLSQRESASALALQLSLTERGAFRVARKRLAAAAEVFFLFRQREELDLVHF